MTEINNLPSHVSDGQTGHLNSHQVIHAALKDHEGKVGDAVSTSSLAINEANNAIDRVTALEALGGLSPELPVDGQTANLIEQPETLTHGAVVSLVKKNRPVWASGVLSGANEVLKTRLMAKDIAPIVLVFAGSSTTEGSNVPLANRWVTKIAEKSSHEPVISSYAEAVAALADGPFHKGITVINMGRSGTNAGNYILESEAPVIGSWSPALVMHAIGSNDSTALWGHPDTVRDQVGDRIDAIDAASPLPVAHIVMHQHERYDGTLRYPWKDYLEALLDMAATRPNVRVINVADVFKALRIPGSDPLGLMAADKVHVNSKGHDFYSGVIWDVLNLLEKVERTTIFLDDFNRPDNDDIGGSLPTLGPDGSVWESSTTLAKLHIQDNRLVPELGTGVTSLIDIGAVDYDLTVDFDFLEPGSSVSGVVFRAMDINNRWGVYLGGAKNYVQLYRMVDGANSIVETGPISVHGKAGLATMRILVDGPRVTAWIDNDKVIDYSMTAADNNMSRNWTKIGVRDTGQVLAFDNLRVLSI